MALLDSDLVLDDLEREFDGRGRRTRPLVSPATAVIAAAAVGSAILHFGYASAHFDEYWAYGAFFVAVAWFQLAAAAGILLRPSRGVLVAAGLLNAGVALGVAPSRTVGVAVGPNATTNLSVALPGRTGHRVRADGRGRCARVPPRARAPARAVLGRADGGNRFGAGRRDGGCHRVRDDAALHVQHAHDRAGRVHTGAEGEPDR